MKAHGPEAVRSLVVADRLAAVWVARQEGELVGRQGMVPAVALPAAWVSGLRSWWLNIGTGLPGIFWATLRRCESFRRRDG